MQFDGGFGPAETRLGKQTQAKINCGGIQRVDRFLKFGSDGFLRVEGAGAPDEQLGQVMINAPVAFPVRIGQDTAGNIATLAQMVELIGARAQTRFHIAETLPKR